jgi:Archaeal putative transposase ISC1217
MKILEQALNKIKSSTTQDKFFIILIRALIGTMGNRTFKNMSRYAQIEEHTFARQMSKSFDFIGLNTEMISSSGAPQNVLIAAQDSTFIAKSGKKTSGLGFCWNSSADKIEKGLEYDVIAVIQTGKNKEGYALSAEQAPTSQLPKHKRNEKKVAEFSKIDFCVEHVKKVLPKLKSLGIEYIASDAFFSKNKYVNGIVELGLNMVGKLRKDASLHLLYGGPQKSRGRKKIFDTGKVTTEYLEQLPVVKVNEKTIELHGCTAYSKSLGREIKVVLVRKKISATKYGHALLFSTDLELDAAQIYEFYVSRFQIEFIFRDSKGFAGLGDCQSRDAKRMHYHFNASLSALNTIKIQDIALQKINATSRPFSMASWSRKYTVDIFINRIISTLGLDQTLIKSHPNYDNALSFGRINY